MKFLLITLVLFIYKASSLEIGGIKANVKIGTLPENVTQSIKATKNYQFLVDTVIRMAELGWDHVKEPYEPFQTNNIKFSIWNIYEVHVEKAHVKGLFNTKKSSNTVGATLLGSQRIMKVSGEEENKAISISAILTVKEKRTGNVVLQGAYLINVKDLSQKGAFGIEENYYKDSYQITSAELQFKLKSVQILKVSPTRRNSGGTLPIEGVLKETFDDIARGIVQHGIETINKKLGKFTVTQIDAYLGLSLARPKV